MGNMIHKHCGHDCATLHHFCPFCPFCLVWQFLGRFPEKRLTKQKVLNIWERGRSRITIIIYDWIPEGTCFRPSSAGSQRPIINVILQRRNASRIAKLCLLLCRKTLQFADQNSWLMTFNLKSKRSSLYALSNALMIFNAFHSTSVYSMGGPEAGPRCPGSHWRPPWPPRRSVSRSRPWSRSEPPNAALCRLGEGEVTVSIGRQDHDRKHPVVMAISCLGAWLIQDYKRYWWRISSESFLVPYRCRKKAEMISEVCFRTLSGSPSNLVHSSCLSSPSLKFMKNKNHLRSIQ